MIKQTIQGYKILRKIGEGGMGEVFYAENEMGMCAAIKVMRPEYRNRSDLRKRFITEIRTMVKLQGHPNIVELKSSSTVDDAIIIMEYLEGVDLYHYVKEHGRISDENMLLEWIKQIISALQFAHDKGIVHRDIKPSNIFLTKHNVIKVLDFGIAKVLMEDEDGNVDSTLLESVTRTHSSLGSPQFMSPEQTFDPKLVTPRSDIYSLGKTINYLVTGGNPMTDISSQYSEVIDKSTKQKPADRYQDCDEIIAVLNVEEVEYENCKTITDYDNYLKKHPDGKYSEQALEEIEKLYYFDKCSTKKGCETYLKKYPNGKYVKSVKNKLETILYNNCNTINSCGTYLKKFPYGKYVDEIKNKLNDLQEESEDNTNNSDTTSSSYGESVSSNSYSSSDYEPRSWVFVIGMIVLIVAAIASICDGVGFAGTLLISIASFGGATSLCMGIDWLIQKI